MNKVASNHPEVVRRAAAPVALALLLAAAQAGADSHVYPASNEPWKAECGECHVAYPPKLLPASSWRTVMSGLDMHFGTDASVDAATAMEIAVFLERNAGRERKARDGTPPLRITETRWFLHKHDELPPSIWNHPQVKTAANCGACHTGADQGNFSEHNIKVPK